MAGCLKAQILWDVDNVEMFGDLCRRSLGLCEEGQPCPPIPHAGQILLVSSQRGLAAAQHSTEAAGQALPEAYFVGRASRSGEAES